MSLNRAQDLRGNVLGVVPMLVEPLLQNRYGPAGDLDIQFNVLREAWKREIRGTDQGRGSYDLEAGMRDVCLGVEFVLTVHPTCDLP